MTRVFLLDVDNTLIDNDRAKGDLDREIRTLVRPDRAGAFWSVYEEVRQERGGVDFPETLRRFRRAFPDEARAGDVERAVMSVPFERYLFPRALDVIAYLWTLGTVGGDILEIAPVLGTPVPALARAHRDGLARALGRES